MTERLITAALLRKRKACEGQVDAFEREWPEGMAVTAANLARCRALGLNVEWGGTPVVETAAGGLRGGAGPGAGSLQCGAGCGVGGLRGGEGSGAGGGVGGGVNCPSCGKNDPLPFKVAALIMGRYTDTVLEWACAFCGYKVSRITGKEI